jgi:HSP20 family molecular chaperone IbpA
MFKLFGLWEEDNHEKKVQVRSEWEFMDDDDYNELWESEESELGQISLDVLENHQSIYILAPVAGVELSDIDISVHETTLTISWMRNKPKEFYEHSMQIKNEECFWWKFTRKIILWENMDFSQIQAVMENNLLVIHIPKIRFDSKNIKINRIQS